MASTSRMVAPVPVGDITQRRAAVTRKIHNARLGNWAMVISPVLRLRNASRSRGQAIPSAMIAEVAAPSSRAASRSSLVGEPVTLSTGWTRFQRSPVTMRSMSRIAPVVSSLPWTNRP